jgi:DNA-binding transcriptional ArsR family regulator
MRRTEIARNAGVDERTVSRILKQLEDAGYLSSSRVANRNEYQLHLDRKLQEPRTDGTVGSLVAALTGQDPTR